MISVCHFLQYTSDLGKNKQTSELIDTTYQMHFTDMYRMSHPNIKECTLYSAAYRNFSRKTHILEHKTNPYKFKEIKITPWILSHHNVIQLKTDSQQTPSKYTKSWNIQTHYWMRNEKNQEIKDFLELHENENMPKLLRHVESSPRKEIYNSR